MKYVVYIGWAFPEKVAEFRSKKKTIAFIEAQSEPDLYCFDKIAE